MPELSIIVPVYNGEKTIRSLYSSISAGLDGGPDWEVIFVYDCGNDGSWSIITDLARAGNGKVRAYRLARNYGQHPAILFGMKQASGRYIVTLDEDMQHNPGHINILLAEIKKGTFDVVYARFTKLKHPGLRIATSEMLRRVLKNIVPGLYPGYSPFRIIEAATARRITELRNPYTFIDGYLGMVTGRFGEVGCEHRKRADGRSSYTFLKLFRHALFIAIAYSPLKRWLLLTSLILNFAAAALFMTTRLTGNDPNLMTPASVAVIAGLGTLVLALAAEIIHYRGLKNNRFPVATEVL